MNATLLTGIFAVLNRITRTFSQFLILFIFLILAHQAKAVDVTIVYTPVTPVCHGTLMDLTKQINVALSTSDLVFSYYSDKALSVVVPDPTKVGPGVYFVKGYRPDPYGLAAVEILLEDITVPNGVTASATPSPICAGQSLTLTGAATGATIWSWTGPNSFTSSLQSPSINAITTADAGVYTLTASNICFSAAPVNTAPVSVDATTPTGVTAIANPNPVCAGNALILTGGASGAATWNWTGPNGFTSSLQNSSVPGITTAGAGAYTLTANNSCGASPIPATVTVTVNPVPVATFSYSSTPYCSNAADPLPSFSGGGIAGVFSSTAGLTFISTATGQVDLSASTPGTYTVTNTIAAAGNCGQVVSTSQITITAQPTATISYNGSPWCSNAPVQNVTLVGLSGGLFSAPTGLTIDPATGAITPGTSTAGNYLVTYTLAASGGCGTIATTTSVAITALPVATFSYTGSPYCNNTANPSPTFNGGIAGNFSSSPGLVFISTSTGQVDLTASTPGTYSVINTVAAAGCSIVTASSGITINASPKATISYSGSPWCNSAGIQNVTLIGTSGGVFSASPAGLTINSATGAVTPGTSTTGSYTVTYTFAATGGCSAVTATTSVTINNLPTAAITYAGSPYCKTLVAVQPVSLTGSTGGIYTSVPAGLTIDPATGAITPNSSAPGSYVVSYTIAAAGGCGPIIATTSVIISDLASAAISYSGSPYCNSIAIAQPVTQSGTIGGVYSAIAGLTLDATTGAITPGTSTAGNYTVTYSIASGGCGIVTATTPVTITASPVATFSYTGSPYCTNAANPLPTFSSGGLAGAFSSTPGLVFVSTATGQINLSASTPGNYTVTNIVDAAAGCGPVQATATVSLISTVPTGVTATASLNPICEGNALMLTGNATGASVWSWSGPNSFISSLQSPTISAITSAATGDYVLTASNSCGVGPVSTLPVIVKPVIVPTVTGNASVCAGASGIIYTTEAGKTGYIWTISSGGTITANSGNSIVADWNTAGAQWVKVNYSNANGCAAVVPTQYDVTVNPLPTQVLTGSNGTINATVSGGTPPYSYSWSGPGSFTANTEDLTGLTYGVYNLNVTDKNGCSVVGSLLLKVSPVAVDDQVSTIQNIVVTKNIVSNDTDADGTIDASTVDLDPLTAGIQTTYDVPNKGTFIVSASGEITFTPFLDFYGIVVIQYVVKDNDGLLSNAANITINVISSNTPPVAVDDHVTIAEHELATGNLFSNDTDPEGKTLTLETFTIGSTLYAPGTTATITDVGTIVINIDGTFTFTPLGHYFGIVPPVSYKVVDVEALSATATLYITVTPVNDVPVAVPDNFVAKENNKLEANVLTNDYDIEGDKITIDIIPVQSPAHGTLVLSENGDFTYQPVIDFMGTDTFTYQICDDGNPSLCSTAVVTIVVEKDENCPVLVPNTFTPNGDGIHDYFKVRCLYNYENPVIEIFNRGGIVVFKKDHYGNLDFWGSEDQAFWNGRSENKWNLMNDELPVGTYYYVLKLGDGKVLTGFIFLGK